MDLFEYQGKDLFARHGIPLADRIVAGSPEEAREAAERLGGQAAVKVQVQIGGRGKGGGIVLARTPDEAEEAARKMLEGGFRGMVVPRVLLEKLVDIAGEFYFAITLDRTKMKYLAMMSSKGGVDIEEIARSDPEAIRRAPIDPILGLKGFQVRHLVGHLSTEARDGAASLIPKLYDVLVACDATLVEVNPLALLADGTMLPLDAKVTIDDNALYRQPELAALRSSFPVDPTQARANERGLQYVKLDGEVGIVGNGAGLVMSTLDLVTQAGGRPANFLDLGGTANADTMASALEVLLSDPAVRSILINIFGGIVRGEQVAQGVLQALSRVEAGVPIVVRLDGTNADEGRRILKEADHPKIIPVADMVEGATRAVQLARAPAGAPG